MLLLLLYGSRFTLTGIWESQLHVSHLHWYLHLSKFPYIFSYHGLFLPLFPDFLYCLIPETIEAKWVWSSTGPLSSELLKTEDSGAGEMIQYLRVHTVYTEIPSCIFSTQGVWITITSNLGSSIPSTLLWLLPAIALMCIYHTKIGLIKNEIKHGGGGLQL